MHRFAIGVFAGIVSVVLGATLYAGHEARAYYLDTLAAIPEHPLFALRSVAYRRGFVRSSAVTVVELALPAMPGNTGAKVQTNRPASEPLRVVLRHEVEHLPRFWGDHAGLFVIETRLDTQDPRQGEFVKSIGAPEPLHLVSRMALDGATHSRVSVAPFRRQQENTAQTIHWQGLEGTLETVPDSASLSFSLHSPGLRAVGERGEFELGALAMQGDLQRGPYDLWFGTQSFRLSRIQLSAVTRATGESGRFSIGPLEFSGETVAKGDRLASAARMTVNDIRYNSRVIRRVQVASGVDNLRMASVAALRDAMRAVQQRRIPREEQQLALTGVALQHLSDLIAGKPVLRIDELNVETSFGALDARLDLTATGALPVADQNPLALLAAVQGSAQLAVPQAMVQALAAARVREALKTAYAAGEHAMPAGDELDRRVAEQVEQQLLQLEAQGFLVRNNGRYTVQVELGGADLRINGTSFAKMLAAAAQGAVTHAP